MLLLSLFLLYCKTCTLIKKEEGSVEHLHLGSTGGRVLLFMLIFCRYCTLRKQRYVSNMLAQA